MTFKAVTVLIPFVLLSTSCNSTLSRNQAKVGVNENAAFFTGEIWVAPGNVDIKEGRTVYLGGIQRSNAGGDVLSSLNRNSLKSIYGGAMTPKASSSSSKVYNVRQ